MKIYGLIPTLLFFTVTSASAKLLWADYKTPKENDVIAKTSKTISGSTSLTKLDLEQISELLDNSERVGNSEVNIGLLKKELKQHFKQNPTIEVRYLYAKVLQKEHAFDEALAVLQQNNDNIHVNSQLLAANLLMTKGQFAEAKRRCLSLLGLTSIETAATCALDAESHTGNAAKSFEGLQQVTANKTLTFNTRHVLAELAYRTNNVEQTLQYLSDVDLSAAPISLLVLWSDANLALGNFDKVLDVLPALVPEHSSLEDALLLRLTLAEAQTSSAQANAMPTWLPRMRARVQLREQRQDTFHASDLALYYLEVANNNEKARYWAEINWQQAKLDQDRLLLQRVNAQFEPTVGSGSPQRESE